MNVELIAHTRIANNFMENTIAGMSEGQMVAFTAIRTCYSANKPTEILKKEGEKYVWKEATDGEGGTDADRLFRHIVRSGHTSTLEHITFTFAIEGISRACLAQLTRHRVGFSYSVQSQRYVKFGSDDKSGGFDHVMPQSVKKNPVAVAAYAFAMGVIQQTYNELREEGVPAEDARMVLPNAATCNLVMTANLRALLDFYSKRRKGRGAQWEIADLAEKLREEVIAVEPWTERFFKEA